jgi:hypothetical protein
MKKLYDLTVKVGEYEKNGETKSRYENIGSVMENDKGGRFIFLKKTFNPAGVPSREGSSDIIVSMFKPKDATDNAPPASAVAPANTDDIPF